MNVKFAPLIFKIAITCMSISAFYIQKRVDTDFMAQQYLENSIEEFDIREDALEKKLRPLIERNNLINARASPETNIAN